MGRRRLPRAEDGLAPDRRVAVDADGAELEVLEWGDPGGRPVVFWHGVGPLSPGALHANVIGPSLASGGLRVVAPSAPGFGASPPLPPRAYSVERMAKIAVAAFDALGLDRAVWIGFSWGGRVGLRVDKERLHGLALLDSGYLEFQEQPGYVRRTQDEWLAFIEADLASLRFESWDAFLAEARAHIRWTRGAEERLRAAVRERDGTIEPRASASVLAGAFAAIDAEPDGAWYAALEAAKLPVLVLAATQPPDWEDVRARALERFARAVPRAEIRRIVDAGHDVLGEAPEQTIPALRRWLVGSVGV